MIMQKCGKMIPYFMFFSIINAEFQSSILQKNAQSQIKPLVLAIESAGLGNGLKELQSIKKEVFTYFDQDYINLLNKYKQAEFALCLKKSEPSIKNEIALIEKKRDHIIKKKQILLKKNEIKALSNKRDVLENTLKKTIASYGRVAPKNMQEQKQRQAQLSTITREIDTVTETLGRLLSLEEKTKLVQFNTQLRNLDLELQLLTVREAKIVEKLFNDIVSYQPKTFSQEKQNEFMHKYMQKITDFAQKIQTTTVILPDGSKKQLIVYFKQLQDSLDQPENTCLLYTPDNDLLMILLDIIFSLKQPMPE